jgi:hypothetical protein
MIHRSPEVVHLAVDLHADLIKLPLPLAKAAHPAHPLPPDVRCEQRPEPVPPVAHRLMRDIDAALQQQVFHVPKLSGRRTYI